MKIIDLLNKIANGEDVPKKIAIKNDVLIHNEEHILYLQDYYCMSDEENATWKIWAYKLNDEVEILEEENKIPEKLKSLNKVGNVPNLVEFADKQHLNNHLIKDKLNEVIDYLDYLKSKGE